MQQEVRRNSGLIILTVGIMLVVIFLLSMRATAQTPEKLTGKVKPTVFSLSMVMMHDVVNPPAASRFYAYSLLGACDIVSQHEKKLISPASVIRNYRPAKIEMKADEYDYTIAALYAILETGRLLLPSGFMLQEKQEAFIAYCKKEGFDEKKIVASVKVAEQVSMHVVNYSKSDGYSKLSTRIRYTPVKADGYWYPTPPAYMEAVEPNWRTIRPMLLDSCNAFLPAKPTAFSVDSNSRFYALAKEVYAVSKNPGNEQLNIAAFWDCNPFVVATSGHMSLGFKKISPGGHWMNIAGIACEKAKADFGKSIFVHTMVAATLMDAFISCWDEKYRSNRIRPEAFINKYIDAKWQPLLQTPPFPEYTSGHSVASTAAAEVLSSLIGDKFAYTDDTELMFELPERSFASFRAAANEAAISRLYGGIHYRDAIEKGQEQGEKIGKFVVQRMQAVRPL